MTELKIIGLCGRAGVGKDEAARYLISEHAFEQIALAWPIKEMLQALPEILESDLELRMVKEIPHPFYEISPRRLMQSLGDWGRELDQNFWIRIAEQRIAGVRDYNKSLETFGLISGVVISDLRLETELEWVRRLGGQVWHIYRDGASPVIGHVTERRHLPTFGDKILHNNGTLEQLFSSVEELLK